MGLVEKVLVGWVALSVPVGVLLGRVIRLRDRAAAEAVRRDRPGSVDEARTRRAS